MSPGFADVRYGDWKHDIVFRTEDEDVRQDLVRKLGDTMRATDWLTRHPLGSIDGMRASRRGGPAVMLRWFCARRRSEAFV